MRRMSIMVWLVWVLVAFGCGSLPFAVWLGKWNGVDIRTVGSGNPGASNLGRAVGKKWGLLCFALDVLKGLLPVLAFKGLGWLRASTGLRWVEAVADPMWQGGAYQLHTALAGQWVAIGLAAVLGHMFSPWLRFKGGKGVATGLGAALGLAPFVTLPGVVCGVVWVVVAKLTGYVGLSSCIAAGLLPALTAVNCWWLGVERGPAWVFVSLSAVLAALVIVRHRSNLVRTVRGTEPKAKWTGRG